MMKTKNGRVMLSLKCAVCSSKKTKIGERTKNRKIME